MTFALKFEQKAISDLELDYVKLYIKPEQIKLINEISKMVCSQIDIPIIAMRATTWKAMRNWQVKSNKAISDISNMTPSEKIIATKEIFNLGRKCMKCLLSQPREKSEILVDIAFEKAFKYYIEYLNRTNQ